MLRSLTVSSIYRAEAAGWRSAFVHEVASKELADASGNRLWALYVQQMCHALNRAVLDLWEPRVEQLVAIHK